MAKTIVCFIDRWNDGSCVGLTSNIFYKSFCYEEFRLAAPALCKGLRPGQSRKLVLTQTKRGIKLEVKKESEVKP